MTIFDTPTNITNLAETLPFFSDVTGGVLGIMGLIIISFGMLALTSNFSTRDSLLVSSFSTFVAGIFFRYLGIINDYVWFISVVFVIVAGIFALLSRDIPGG